MAKILGVYRIGYKISQNNTEKKLDLLVMENLFYGRKMAQVRTLDFVKHSAVRTLVLWFLNVVNLRNVLVSTFHLFLEERKVGL